MVRWNALRGGDRHPYNLQNRAVVPAVKSFISRLLMGQAAGGIYSAAVQEECCEDRRLAVEG